MSELYFSEAPSKTAGLGLKALGLTMALLALVLHIHLALAVITQPLDVGMGKGEGRAPTWWLYNDAVHRIGPGGDFFALYHAGVADEQERSLYAEIEKPHVTPYYYPYRYLPIFAQTVGLAFLDFSPLDAYKLWGLILLGAAFCGFVLLAQSAKSNGERLFAVVLFALNTPLFLEYHMGQFTFLATLLACIAALWGEWLLTRPRPGDYQLGERFGAGSFFCIAVLIKLFPISAVPVWLKRGRYGLGLCALALPIALSAPYFYQNPHEWTRFWEVNLSTPGGGLDSGNFSPLYIVYLLAQGLGAPFDKGDFMHASGFVHSAFLALTLLIVLFSRERNLFAGLAAMLLAHFVSYVHLWEHHISAVFFVGLLFWLLRERLCARLGPLATALLLASLILLALPSPSALFDPTFNITEMDPSKHWSLAVKLFVAGSKALPLLAIWGVVVWSHWRAGFARPWRRSAARLASLAS